MLTCSEKYGAKTLKAGEDVHPPHRLSQKNCTDYGHADDDQKDLEPGPKDPSVVPACSAKFALYSYTFTCRA